MTTARMTAPVRFLGVATMFVGALSLMMWRFHHSLSIQLMLTAVLVVIVALPTLIWLFGGMWLRACGAVQAKASLWDCLLLRQIQLAFATWLLCVLLKHVGPFPGREDPMQLFASSVGLVCLCLAAFSTQWLGSLRYTGWNFYQPYSGGALFVMLQGVAWTVLGISVFMLGLNLICPLARILNLACLTCLPTQVGALSSVSSAIGLGLVSELVLACSLCIYKDDPSKPCWTLSHCVVFAFSFFIVKPDLALFLFALLSQHLVMPVFGLPGLIALWVVCWVWYLSTYTGEAHTSGRRSWPAVQHWLRTRLFDPVFVPFFQLKIVSSATLLPAGQDSSKYIFGYHPHGARGERDGGVTAAGIVPTTACWATLTSLWKERFPGVTPAALTSTVIHSVPFARDLTQFCGGYDVSRAGFENALSSVRSVLLIPGGQHEMLGSHSTSRHIPINTHHKGFIRMALTHGACLVPMYSFGETQTYDNAPFPQWMQRWCMKKLRANLLTLPYGAWPFCPRRVPITIAVGSALPQIQAYHPTEALVNLVHGRYFSALEDLFNKHKAEAGHHDDQLQFTADFKRVTAEEFEHESKHLILKRALEAAPLPSMPRSAGAKGWSLEMTMIGIFVFLIFVASLLV